MDISSLENQDFKVIYVIHHSLGVVAGVVIGRQPIVPEDALFANIPVVRLHFPMSMQVAPQDPNDQNSPMNCTFIPMVIALKPIDLPINGQAVTGWGILSQELESEYVRILTSRTVCKSKSTDTSSSED